MDTHTTCAVQHELARQSAAGSTAQLAAELQSTLTAETRRIEQAIAGQLQTHHQALGATTRETLDRALSTEAPYRPSSVAPPTPSASNEVSMMLARGEVGQAMTKALGARDLELVMDVCKAFDPVKLFKVRRKEWSEIVVAPAPSPLLLAILLLSCAQCANPYRVARTVGFPTHLLLSTPVPPL